MTASEHELREKARAGLVRIMNAETEEASLQILVLLLKNAAPPVPTKGRMFAIGAVKWAGIGKLIEECGEVLQVCGKLIGTYGHTFHWDGTDLQLRLQDELADLSAAMAFVFEINTNINYAAVEERAHKKIRRFLAWHTGEELCTCPRDTSSRLPVRIGTNDSCQVHGRKP